MFGRGSRAPSQPNAGPRLGGEWAGAAHTHSTTLSPITTSPVAAAVAGSGLNKRRGDTHRDEIDVMPFDYNHFLLNRIRNDATLSRAGIGAGGGTAAASVSPHVDAVHSRPNNVSYSARLLPPTQLSAATLLASSHSARANGEIVVNSHHSDSHSDNDKGRTLLRTGAFHQSLPPLSPQRGVQGSPSSTSSPASASKKDSTTLHGITYDALYASPSSKAAPLSSDPNASPRRSPFVVPSPPSARGESSKGRSPNATAMDGRSGAHRQSLTQSPRAVAAARRVLTAIVPSSPSPATSPATGACVDARGGNSNSDRDAQDGAAASPSHQQHHVAMRISALLSDAEPLKRAAIVVAEASNRSSLRRIIRFALDDEVWPLRFRLLVGREEPAGRWGGASPRRSSPATSPLSSRKTAVVNDVSSSSGGVVEEEMKQRTALLETFAEGLLACAEAEERWRREAEGRPAHAGVTAPKPPQQTASHASSTVRVSVTESKFRALSSESDDATPSPAAVDETKTATEAAAAADPPASLDWGSAHPPLAAHFITVATRRCVAAEASARKAMVVTEEPSERAKLLAAFAAEIRTEVEAKRQRRRHGERLDEYRAGSRALFGRVAMRVIAEDVMLREVAEREALVRHWWHMPFVTPSLATAADKEKVALWIAANCPPQDHNEGAIVEEKGTAMDSPDGEPIAALHVLHAPKAGDEDGAANSAESMECSFVGFLRALPIPSVHASSTTSTVAGNVCAYPLALPEATARNAINAQMMAERHDIERQLLCRAAEIDDAENGASLPFSETSSNGGRSAIAAEEEAAFFAMALQCLLPAQEAAHRAALVTEAMRAYAPTTSETEGCSSDAALHIASSFPPLSFEAYRRSVLLPAMRRGADRAAACVVLQRWLRAVRLGLRGWRATHRRVGGWCALYRQRKAVEVRRAGGVGSAVSGWGEYEHVA